MPPSTPSPKQRNSVEEIRRKVQLLKNLETKTGRQRQNYTQLIENAIKPNSIVNLNNLILNEKNEIIRKVKLLEQLETKADRQRQKQNYNKLIENATKPNSEVNLHKLLENARIALIRHGEQPRPVPTLKERRRNTVKPQVLSKLNNYNLAKIAQNSGFTNVSNFKNRIAGVIITSKGLTRKMTDKEYTNNLASINRNFINNVIKGLKPESLPLDDFATSNNKKPNTPGNKANNRRQKAATTIAAAVKGAQARKKFAKQRNAATTIAAAVKGAQVRKSNPLRLLKEKQKQLRNFTDATTAALGRLNNITTGNRINILRAYLNKYNNNRFKSSPNYQKINQAVTNYNKIKPDLNSFSEFLDKDIGKTDIPRRVRAYKIRCAKILAKGDTTDKFCSIGNFGEAIKLKVALESINTKNSNAQQKLSALQSEIKRKYGPMKNSIQYKSLSNVVSRVQSAINRSKK